MLEHDRVEERTDELLQGERQVAIEGRDGLRRDPYEVVLVDGTEESAGGGWVVNLTNDDGPNPSYTRT